MATADGPAMDLGSLFVSITGRSTIVARQCDEIHERVDDGAEFPVATYVNASVQADGLDEAIDEPGSI